MSATLLDRTDELEVLEAVLSRLDDGEGSVVVVDGPAGSGKTSLLAGLRDVAGRMGVRVWDAVGDELESILPYEILRQLLAAPLQELPPSALAELLDGPAAVAYAALMHPSGMLTEPVAPEAFDHGLYWLLSGLVLDTRTVVVVDDLQWSDPASSRGLAYLAERVEDLGVGFVFGRRIGDPGESIGSASRSIAAAAAEHVQLGGLSSEAIRAMLEQDTGSAVDDEVITAYERVTGGNAMLVSELVAHVGTAVSELEDEGPNMLLRRVTERLGALSTSTRQALAVVAMLGESFAVSRGARVLRRPEADLADTLEWLCQHGWLRDTEPLTFVHPLYLQAALGDLSPSRAALMRLRAAQVLQEDGAEERLVALQLLRSEPVGDVTTVEVLTRAGRSAMAQGAPEEARIALERALEEPARGGLRQQVLRELAVVQSVLGDGDRALEMLREVLALPQPMDDRVAAIEQLTVIGRHTSSPEAVVALIEGQLQAHEWKDEQREIVDGAYAMALLFGPRPETRVEAVLRPYLGLSVASTPAQALVLSLLARHGHAFGHGPEWSLERIRAAQRLSRGLDRWDHSTFHLVAMYCTLVCGQLHETLAMADQWAKRAQRMGLESALQEILSLRAVARAMSGQLLTAEEDVFSLKDGAISPMVGACSVWACTLMYPMVGADAEMERLGTSVSVRPGSMPETRLRFADLVAARLSGRYGAAGVAADRIDELERESPNLVQPLTPWRLELALAAHAAGETAHARDLVATQAVLDRAWPTGWNEGLRLRTEGVVMGGEIEAFAASVEVLEHWGARAEAALSRVMLGSALRAAGKRRDAVRELGTAIELARECDATAVVRRANDELEILTAQPEAHRVSGYASLTAAERRVARLAAEGRRNREIAQSLFVAERTVENQLGRVYDKLGIGSRVELGDALVGGRS